MKMDDQTIIAALRKVTLRLRDRFLFPDSTWELKKNQHWAVLGPNGAGKSTLVRALTGEVAVVRGRVETPAATEARSAVGYLSFEDHRRLAQREHMRDESRCFSGRWDDVMTVRQLFLENRRVGATDSDAFERMLDNLRLRHLMQRGVRFLSTGELRRVLIGRVLMQQPTILVLDEPFDGLDVSARRQMADLVNRLMTGDTTLLLVTHRMREILPNITHVIGVRSGTILFQGRRQKVLTPQRIERLYRRGDNAIRPVSPRVPPQEIGGFGVSNEIIAMREVLVRYGSVTIIKDLNWTVKKGENWVVCGPNGCGKTTLLSLVTAEHVQAYSNHVRLFGRRRGSGESIWEIKRLIGMMSSEFQIRYRKSISAFEVVLSGFFDSVGLFHRGSSRQRFAVEETMAALGIDALARRNFSRLSTGEQRMVLLARALVKKPRLLVLDEPCQGLDRSNRQLILDTVDRMGGAQSRTIIFVTHHADELPACMSHMLSFQKKADGGFAYCGLSLSA